MWPLTGLEIVALCGGRSATPALEELVIAGVNVGEGPPAPDELFVALREAGVDGHDWAPGYLQAGAALALVSADWPGLAALPAALGERCVVVDDTLGALRRLAARLRRRFPFPVVAVGGSNGKTTTKEMIAALLAGPGFRVTKTPETRNGFTGLPLTLAQRAHAVASAPHALVVEIGIDAPGAMAEHAALIDPDVAVITALGPEHLEGLGSWDTAAAEELVLFEASPRLRRVFQARDPRVRARLADARAGDVIVCDEDEVLRRRGVSVLTSRASCPTPFASEVDLVWHPDGVEPAWRGRVRVPMPGLHNADNLAAAFGAALALGRTPRELLAGWPSFAPPEMRCQATALPPDGVLLDDTYNASPSSMEAALALLQSPVFRLRRKVLVLGDMLELGAASERWHLALVEPLRALANARLCLFGDAMRAVHEALVAAGVPASFLPPDADPRAFLSSPEVHLDGAVVLVKGSRGMRLEQVVDAILRRSREARSSPLVGVGVVGSRRSEATAGLLAALLARLAPGRFAVVALTAEALALGLAATGRFHAAIFTDFAPDPEGAPGSAERALGLMAQLFLPLPPGAVAVLCEGDDATELLAEIVPAAARVVRYLGSDAASAALAGAIALGIDAAAARAALGLGADPVLGGCDGSAGASILVS